VNLAPPHVRCIQIGRDPRAMSAGAPAFRFSLNSGASGVWKVRSFRVKPLSPMDPGAWLSQSCSITFRLAMAATAAGRSCIEWENMPPARISTASSGRSFRNAETHPRDFVCDRHGDSAGSQKCEGLAVIWVIEYSGAPCWIAERVGSSAAFDVTFQRKFARRFLCREDANHEILRLGLSGQWRGLQYEKEDLS
jgi:hypothetical protein